jgi:type IV secretory pathway TraG/TraD family ATPase VirD4
MRDGVNINSSAKIERLVLSDEIKNLESRTCFVKLCGNYPITKLTVKLQSQNKLLALMYKSFANDSGVNKCQQEKNIKEEVARKPTQDIEAQLYATSADSVKQLDSTNEQAKRSIQIKIALESVKNDKRNESLEQKSEIKALEGIKKNLIIKANT